MCVPFTGISTVMGITVFTYDITDSFKVHLLCLLKVLRLSNSNSLVGTADFPEALVTEDARKTLVRFHCTWFNNPDIEPNSVN